MQRLTMLAILAPALLLVAGLSAPAQADVTGTIGAHIAVEPFDDVFPTESDLINLDLESSLTLNVAISGLTTTFHTHFGIAGLEDVILTSSATLGALDLRNQLVFGRFDFGRTRPFGQFSFQDQARFVRNETEVSISLGGVSFSNLAIVEDTLAFKSQSSAVAFGDVITLSGQTPSGISVTAQTGICAEPVASKIKKHELGEFSVNIFCAAPNFARAVEKPELLFDFERLTFSGIPLASGITANAQIECVKTTACTVDQTINFSGVGPIPFEANFSFTDLFSLSFGGAVLTFSSGPATLDVCLDSTGQITLIDLDASTTLNPDTNPAQLTLDTTFEPGMGLKTAKIALNATRSNLDMGTVVTFGPGPPAEFKDITMSLGTDVGPFNVQSEATFEEFRLAEATVDIQTSF